MRRTRLLKERSCEEDDTREVKECRKNLGSGGWKREKRSSLSQAQTSNSRSTVTTQEASWNYDEKEAFAKSPTYRPKRHYRNNLRIFFETRSHISLDGGTIAGSSRHVGQRSRKGRSVVTNKSVVKFSCYEI